MDEYIKRQDVIKHLRGTCIAKYPLSFSYGIFASADEISKLPTADVVPKSEVEQLNHKYDLAVAEREANVKGFTDDLAKVKAEVAREIFNEFEEYLSEKKFGTFYYNYLKEIIAELKNKYTEEKHEN